MTGGCTINLLTDLYQTIAIGVGVGALIGFLFATRRTCPRH
jgi:ElaB/YqjD/DUF883 family membrane-anchored ribosome-binding protein